MKVLLLDAGNTRLKWALVDTATADQLQSIGACSYADAGFPEQLQSAWGELPRVEKVLLGCVAGDAIITTLDEIVRRNWNVSLDRLVSETAHAGIINGYTNPGQLGVDRWLAMIGGRRSLGGPSPMWIVDCGSAVTIDYVERNGRHRGGLILPGLMMMYERMTAMTALKSFNFDAFCLPGAVAGLVKNGLAKDGLATDTASALCRGIMASLVASLDRITGTDENDMRIITGGDSALIGPQLSGHWLIRPHLVLEGMAVYAEECG